VSLDTYRFDTLDFLMRHDKTDADMGRQHERLSSSCPDDFPSIQINILNPRKPQQIRLSDIVTNNFQSGTQKPITVAHRGEPRR